MPEVSAGAVDDRQLLVMPLPIDVELFAAVISAAAPAWEARYGMRPTTAHLVQRDTPWGTAAVLLPPTQGEA
ncbi:hypothetical protein ACFFMN_33825 [Planobispora siamensis]|uniref:Uncharacterized protein n=1 Tax=Planobispora siamensis TaxID=936338 RepID=A0A8J3WIN5_9ACTN|nr:hypothetical protein [Planobispora siamensis]GIH91969.1 hypothetical protein Psi01_25990 [Planobispora siamensis]